MTGASKASQATLFDRLVRSRTDDGTATKTLVESLASRLDENIGMQDDIRYSLMTNPWRGERSA